MFFPFFFSKSPICPLFFFEIPYLSPIFFRNPLRSPNFPLSNFRQCGKSAYQNFFFSNMHYQALVGSVGSTTKRNFLPKQNFKISTILRIALFLLALSLFEDVIKSSQTSTSIISVPCFWTYHVLILPLRIDEEAIYSFWWKYFNNLVAPIY